MAKEEEQDLFGFGDFGDFGGWDTDAPGFDFGEFQSTDMEETRYMPPHIARYKEETFVLYDNAKKLAKDLKISKGMRSDAFIAGSFIYGDFIEAFMVENRAHTDRMTISTLGMSENNVDSLRALMEHGYIGELNLLISVYFWGHERRGMMPYIYDNLDFDNRFQLAVVGAHTKTCHFMTAGGKYMVLHGSANLRSSGSVEQLTIEENENLYNFYEETYSKLLQKYATINKPVRNSEAWEVVSRKFFKD